MIPARIPRSRRANAIVFALFVVFIVGSVAVTHVGRAGALHTQGGRMRQALAARQLLEGGMARAEAQLAASTRYRGEQWIPTPRGEVLINVERIDRGPARRITVVAAMPNMEHPQRMEEIVRIWNP